MRLLRWFLHVPRYFLGHLVGHLALLVQFISLAFEGLAEGIADVARWLADVTDEDEGDDYGDDEGLAV